jgi:hypothetical protein
MRTLISYTIYGGNARGGIKIWEKTGTKNPEEILAILHNRHKIRDITEKRKHKI